MPFNKNVLIPGTISFAQQVGEALRKGTKNPIKALQEIFGDSMYLFLHDDDEKPWELKNDPKKSETSSGGFDRGDMIFQKDGTIIHIINQNENLIAWDENKAEPIAMAPDLICYLRHKL